MGDRDLDGASVAMHQRAWDQRRRFPTLLFGTPHSHHDFRNLILYVGFRLLLWLRGFGPVGRG